MFVFIINLVANAVTIVINIIKVAANALNVVTSVFVFAMNIVEFVANDDVSFNDDSFISNDDSFAFDDLFASNDEKQLITNTQKFASVAIDVAKENQKQRIIKIENSDNKMI